MTLEQLRIFVAVAERQHMTQAARALNLTQSAASAAIAALERRYATALFERVGRRIELTPAGRLFLDEARAVLARAAAAERALAEIGGLRRGTFRVVASQTIASYWLPRHLAAFHRAYPDVEIRMTVGNSAQAAAAVEAGEADIGFIEGMIESAGVELRPVAKDRLVLVAPPQHEWAGRDSLSPGDLAGQKWVMRERGSGTRSAFEAALKRLGIAAASLDVAIEMPSNEAARAAVEAGFGVSALSASVVAPSLEAGLLRLAPLRFEDRAFYAVEARARRRGRAAGALLALIASGGADL
ncbi:LysR family transcriptional regulator [Methylocella sp.]|uniref:LysR family transcriptional regulator n=1 Tax=Methylocella sp. TaxID=1978226 RepID=UPI0037831A54